MPQIPAPANVQRQAPNAQQNEAQRRRQIAPRFAAQDRRYTGVINDALHLLEEFESHPQTALSEGQASFISGLKKLTEGNWDSIEEASDFLQLSSSLGHPTARCMLQTVAPEKVQELERAERQRADEAERRQRQNPDLPKQEDAKKQEEPTKVEKEKEEKNSVETPAKKCAICMDESKDFVTLKCGHNIACRGCLTEMVNNAIKEQNTNALFCPEPDCEKPIKLKAVRSIVHNDQETMAKYDAVLLKKFLDLNKDRKYCPKPGCGLAVINDANRTGNITCEKCKTVFCASCLIPHYDPHMSCADAKKEHNQRLAAGDKQKLLDLEKAEEWEKENTKPCPHCGLRAIQKNGGCPCVTCKCGAEMCWLCGKKWRETGHTDHYYCPILKKRVGYDNQ